MQLEGKSMIFVASTQKWKEFSSYPQVNPDRKNPLGEYVSHSDENGTVEVKGTEGSLFVTPWAPEIVRIFTLKNDATKREPRKSISVVDKADPTLCYDLPDVSYEVEADEETVYIRITGGTEVRVAKASMLVSFYDNDNLLLSESTGLVNSSDGGNSRVGFAANGEEAFYGAGYNGDFVNLDGKSMEMNNSQKGGWSQGTAAPLNICIPYYVSTKGYGVFFDSNYRGASIMANTNGSSYMTSSPTPVAYYYCGGGSMEKAMQNYHLLTGRQPLPPYWALGYISSKFSFIDETETRATITKTREKNIPIDGVVLDLSWQGGSKGTSGTYGMGYLDWDPDNFSNKEFMVQTLLDDDVHTVAICEPFFNSAGNASANYNYLKNQGWLADERVTANGNMNWISGNSEIPVGLIDASNPEAMDWFAGKLLAHSAKGLSAWWFDLGEPEAYTEHYEGNTHHAGGTPSEVHNEFGNLWTGAAYTKLALSEEKAYTKNGEVKLKDMRHMTLPRSGTAGMQRYGAMPWTGDIKRSWGGLQAEVPALVSAAMSGVSFLGSDIGGFTADNGFVDADIYRRWIQLGVFYPMLRTHSATKPEVWQADYDRVRDDVRDAINLRYAYLPYTYTQAYNQTAHGAPIARPINFDDKENPLKNADCIDEYLWGPDILVAPVLTSNDTREIKFPAGDWLDMNDFKTVHEGYSSYTATVPKNRLAHFMRRGSLVTRYKQETYKNTATIEHDKIVVDYFPLYDNTLTHGYFYDDDKTGVDNVRNGHHLLTHFVASASPSSDKNSMAISIGREGDGWEGMPESYDLTFRIRDFRVDPSSLSDETLATSEVNVVWMTVPGPEAQRVRGRGDGKDDWSDTETFKKCSSVDELNAATGNSYCQHDGTFYLRMPAMRTDRNYVMNLGGNMIFTDRNEIVDMSSMTLAYGSGYISYSLPEGTREASLEIYTATGASAASIGALTANGYVMQTPVSLGDGVYIAMLSAKGPDGVQRQKTLKIVVR